ncbi:DUF1543 domain-containing protein [Parasediminibacterium paludis]|uniref:DUF1543 domain-containing protein n=1 Tax=Parasediminibacterium paludis TaxID=908966 RepID=A0ABV8PYE2_9BACT
MFSLQELKLYMLLLGCRPSGRFTEQHDILFAIGENPKALVPQILEFWPEAKGIIHVDAFRTVTLVDGFEISVVEKSEAIADQTNKLFFINLGGYKRGEFDEFHYKMLVVASDKDAAIAQAKQTAFYKHTGFTGAPSHVDDKYGIDVDDVFEIKDILPKALKKKYSLAIQPTANIIADELHLGYYKLDKL